MRIVACANARRHPLAWLTRFEPTVVRQWAITQHSRQQQDTQGSIYSVHVHERSVDPDCTTVAYIRPSYGHAVV